MHLCFVAPLRKSSIHHIPFINRCVCTGIIRYNVLTMNSHAHHETPIKNFCNKLIRNVELETRHQKWRLLFSVVLRISLSIKLPQKIRFVLPHK